MEKSMEMNKMKRKATVSRAEFNVQLVEAIVGAVIAIIGAIMYLFLMLDYGWVAIVIGAYLLICGGWGVFTFCIGNSSEKDEYLAFNDTEVIFYSPKALRCKNIPFEKITKVEQDKDRTMDIICSIFTKSKDVGLIGVFFEEDGEEDVLLYGPIDCSKTFVKELNQAIEACKAVNEGN